ncbi:hypothetical protein AU184_03770 [Mycolicibacterium novocastrense]|nr:hypothetical protein AU183_18100 [Mycolicibacterium novocastrense]KUH71731.1 hypothetical protein AU072_11075 [Mycolicibacterium novocastrense]KUH72048.1 hypothetical protein AU184_03770 [Mycolicibacterium novocastrense]
MSVIAADVCIVAENDEALILDRHGDLVVEVLALAPYRVAVHGVGNLEPLALKRLHRLVLRTDHIEIAKQDVVFDLRRREPAAAGFRRLLVGSNLGVLTLGEECHQPFYFLNSMLEISPGF